VRPWASEHHRRNLLLGAGGGDVVGKKKRRPVRSRKKNPDTPTYICASSPKKGRISQQWRQSHAPDLPAPTAHRTTRISEEMCVFEEASRSRGALKIVF
jgi:hypothetical protein